MTRQIIEGEDIVRDIRYQTLRDRSQATGQGPGRVNLVIRDRGISTYICFSARDRQVGKDLEFVRHVDTAYYFRTVHSICVSRHGLFK